MNLTQLIKIAIERSKLTPFDIELILAYVLKKSREYVLAHPEKKLTKSQMFKFQTLISRRIKGEPVAYLIGHKEFYGFNFKVNKNVLVPRPETELMVEEAMRIITNNTQLTTLIDVGTGSGCVIITLANLIKNFKLFGTDISNQALKVAKQNSRLNKVDDKIKFIRGNLLEPFITILDSCFRRNDKDKNKNLVILANLPYGWSEWKNNSTADTIGLKFEPPIALFTGQNGLELYEKLFKQISGSQTILDITSYVLCEIDPRQKISTKKLIKKYFPKAFIEIKKDLKGHSRLVIITL